MKNNTEYPSENFSSRKEGIDWLKNTPHHNLEFFIKDCLTHRTRFPFQDMPKEDRNPSDVFIDLIYSLKEKAVEKRITKAVNALIKEYADESSIGKNQIIDYKYLFNLINTATVFQLKSSNDVKKDKTLFEWLYNSAYEGSFKDQKVYREDLHLSVLKCLFSFPIPTNYKEKILKLCGANIDTAKYAPLCYREAYELDDSYAIKWLSKYLDSVKEEGKLFQIAPLKRFFNRPEALEVLIENRESLTKDPPLPKQ